MATGISSPLALGGMYPSVDGRYVAANGKPFTSVSNAESALNGFPSKLSESCVGLTVLVKESGWAEAKEYWVQPKGTTPETYGLVEKGAGTTDYNDLDNKPTIGDGTNTALPIVGNVKVSASTASGSTAGVTVTPGQNTGEIEMQFTLPKGDKGEDGADGQDGQDGQDGADAVNPFKGWYGAITTGTHGTDLVVTDEDGNLVAAYPNPAIGDYAYIKTWDIDTAQSPQVETPITKIYECTTAGTWSDSGRTADTSNVQTFASSQEVNETYIDDTHLTNPVHGSLAKAEDVMQLKTKLDSVSASENKVTETPTTGSYVKGANGSIEPANNTAYIEVALGNAKSVRFLGAWFNTSGYTSGYAFGHYTDQNEWVTDKSSVFNTDASTLGTKEYIIDKPDGATHFRTTTATGSVPELAQNFYCYLQSGDTIVDLIEALDIKVFGDGKQINVELGKIANDGSKQPSNTTYINTDLIEIPSSRVQGDSFVWNPGATGSYYFCLYDSDMLFIEGSNFLANATPRTIQTYGADSFWGNAKYIRASFDKDTINNCYIDYVHNGITTRLFSPVTHVEEGMIDKKFPENPSDENVPSTKLISDMLNGSVKYLYNEGLYPNWINNKYVDYRTGEAVSSTVNSITGFINIEGYDSVELIMNVTSSPVDSGVCFYDESFVFKSGISQNIGSSSTTEVRRLQIPEGVKYVKCTVFTSSCQYWYLLGIKNSKIAPQQITQKVTMEFGNLDNQGQIKPYSNDFLDYQRTSIYYKLSHIKLPYTYTIYTFTSDYAFSGTISAQPNVDYDLNSNFWYKIVINFEDNSIETKKELVINLDVIDTSYNTLTAKTIGIFQYLVRYKKGRGIYTQDSNYSEAATFENTLISNTIRVCLPINYSPKGEPVKLIYYAHGTNGYPRIDSADWGGYESALAYLADEGFALYDMFAGTSYYNALTTNRIANYNLPIQLAAQKDAFEWITRNFNVDKQIYIVGKSHGGLAGIYATNFIVPTRAIALLAPLITQIGDLYEPWGLTYDSECSMCLDDMCFIPPDGMTFTEMVNVVHKKSTGWKDIMLSNIRQQSGLNPYLNGITNVDQTTLLTNLMNDNYKVLGGMDNIIRHSDIPVKVWCAPDDNEVVYANGYNWIKSLQNGGSNAQFREFPEGCGRHLFDSFTNEASIKDTVTTSLGVTYTAPRAYIEVVNFLNQF